MLSLDNAIWDDGEWIGWDEINRQIQNKEWGAKYPNADRALIPFFEQLLWIAEDYYRTTGLHLQVYGDIGELYGAITFGLKLHSNYAQGSDGRLGNEFVEVKTITPFKNRDEVMIDMAGHFSKILVVKINCEFEIAHRLIDRKSLPTKSGKRLRLKWNDY